MVPNFIANRCLYFAIYQQCNNHLGAIWDVGILYHSNFPYDPSQSVTLYLAYDIVYNKCPVFYTYTHGNKTSPHIPH